MRLHRILFIFKDINLPKITLTVDLAPTYVKKKDLKKVSVKSYIDKKGKDNVCLEAKSTSL